MRGCNCEIKCIACGLNCRIEAKNKIERTLCGEKKFSVWPDRNYFFKRAVNDLVFRELTCFVPEGIVVVDFSLGNILYFLNECWTRKLRDSGLKIILIADKNMLPMANFWRLRSGFSWAVVEVNSDLSNLINKIKRVMLGRNLLCRRTPSLTEHEMKTLCLLAEGRFQPGYRPYHGVRYPQRLPLSILFMQEVRRAQSPAQSALQAYYPRAGLAVINPAHP